MTRSQRIKRVVDLTVAAIVVTLSAPFMIGIAALIWICEGRPIFYISKRRITADREIPIVKFRTMVRDAASPKYRLRERFMRDGYLDIPRTCEVYTPIGRFLERTQIVELPQMLNVLLHGMSLVGNRPLPAENVRLLQRYPEWRQRFDSPAGISGIAQVVGKLRLSPEQRLELECAYSSLFKTGNIVAVDLRITWQTACVILFSRSMTIEDAYKLVRFRPDEARSNPSSAVHARYVSHDDQKDAHVKAAGFN